MISRSHHKCIIVYALHWPETYAIEGLYRQISPDSQVVTCFTPDALVDALSIHKMAPLILGILPHECLFLLARLTPYLHLRRMLFLAQKFNYADRMLPSYFSSGDIIFYEWKDRKNEQIHKQIQIALLDCIAHKPNKGGGDKNKVIPLTKNLNADELISHVNLYLYQTLPRHKVSEQQRRILFMLSWGWSTARIANILGIHIKTVSAHKLNGLSRLGMGTRSIDVYRGISTKSLLQQYVLLDTSLNTAIKERG